jgi:hypothetical protein
MQQKDVASLCLPKTKIIIVLLPDAGIMPEVSNSWIFDGRNQRLGTIGGAVIGNYDFNIRIRLA